MRMMPAYLEHLQKWPRSLIVRYAGRFDVAKEPTFCEGLYFIQRGEQFIHFVVMRSVFDPTKLA